MTDSLLCTNRENFGRSFLFVGWENYEISILVGERMYAYIFTSHTSLYAPTKQTDKTRLDVMAAKEGEHPLERGPQLGVGVACLIQPKNIVGVRGVLKRDECRAYAWTVAAATVGM